MHLAIFTDLMLAATVASYGVAGVAYFLQLAGRTERGARIGKRVLAAAVVLHIGHFLLTSFLQRACPVEGIHPATSLMALSAAILFLLASRFWRIEVIGAFVAPVAMVALLAARLVHAGVPERPIRSAVLPVHVTAILLASSLFAIASALAATYLLQENQLKQKRAGGLLARLPPLDVLDRASHRFLLAGFPLLTLGILTGVVWIAEGGAGTSHNVEAAWLRQFLAYASWLVFATVLLFRSTGGWRGRRAAWGTILGFGCALLVFLVYLVRDMRAGGG